MLCRDLLSPGMIQPNLLRPEPPLLRLPLLRVLLPAAAAGQEGPQLGHVFLELDVAGHGAGEGGGVVQVLLGEARAAGGEQDVDQRPEHRR